MPDVPPAAPAFRDRSRGLLISGWLLIVLGALCFLFVILLFAIGIVAPSAAGAPAGMGLNGLVYGFLGAGFVALGVGSIRARRWAQAITLSVAWAWLATGILAVAASLVLLPAAFSSAGMPAASAGCAIFAAATVLLVVFVAVPLLFVLFYRREDVRGTVEWRNPAPDWSDRVAMPLLGIIVALAFTGLACLFSVFFLHAVPVMGRVLTGASAAAVSLAAAAASFALAWGTWRRSMAAWWGLMILQLAAVVNFLGTRSLDFAAYMRAAGYPEEQVRQMSAMNPMGNPAMLWIALASSAALFAFLFAVRRHFRTAGSI